MPEPIITTLIALLSIAGSMTVGVNPGFWERRRARRALRAVPVLDATTPEGTHVRVTGVVRALDRTLTAPLSGAECVVYRARVAASNARGWQARVGRGAPVSEAIAMTPFELALPDGGGTVLVEGTHVLLDIARVNIKRVPSERREQFALRQGIQLRDATRATFDEIIVQAGLTITVAGLLIKDAAHVPPSDELAFRDAPPAKRILTGNAEHPIAIGEPVR